MAKIVMEVSQLNKWIQIWKPKIIKKVDDLNSIAFIKCFTILNCFIKS